MSVKLIALDMDGTLLMSDHKHIHPRNCDMIRKATESGIQVWIATGRLPEDVSDYLIRKQLKCGLVCVNGTIAYESPLPDGKKLYHESILPEAAEKVIDMILPYNIMVNAFEPGMVTTVAREESHRYHLLEREGLIQERRGEKAIYEAAKRGILKFYCMEEPGWATEASPIMDEIRERANAISGIKATRSAPGIAEIMPDHVGKGKTLQEIAALYGIAPEEIMAVGDEENDLDMLEMCGYSVAMGNASQKVKETCRFMSTTNDEAGVAEAITYALGLTTRLSEMR